MVYFEAIGLHKVRHLVSSLELKKGQMSGSKIEETGWAAVCMRHHQILANAFFSRSLHDSCLSIEIRCA